MYIFPLLFLLKPYKIVLHIKSIYINMVDNNEYPLTQEHAIEEPLDSKIEVTHKKQKIISDSCHNNQEETINITSLETEQKTNVISEDKFVIERLLATTVEVGASSSDPTLYKLYTAAKTEDSAAELLQTSCQNKKFARAYRYLRGFSRLEETSFWMKTELTADYQGSTVLSASNEHYGSAFNIIKTTVQKEVESKSGKENEEGKKDVISRMKENIERNT